MKYKVSAAGAEPAPHPAPQAAADSSGLPSAPPQGQPCARGAATSAFCPPLRYLQAQSPGKVSARSGKRGGSEGDGLRGPPGCSVGVGGAGRRRSSRFSRWCRPWITGCARHRGKGDGVVRDGQARLGQVPPDPPRELLHLLPGACGCFLITVQFV